MRTPPSFLRATLLALTLGIVATGAHAQQAVMATETFDAVVRIVATTHFDSTRVGLSWAVRAAELRPRAVGATSALELRAVITELLASLGGSHLKVMPKSLVDGVAGAAPGDVGLELRVIDTNMVVFRVTDGSAAAKQGVQAGWIVRSVDGASVAVPVVRDSGVRRARVVAAERLMRTLAGSAGTFAPVTFVDAAGGERKLTLERTPPVGTPAQLQNLPTGNAVVRWRRFSAPAAGGMGVIAFSTWHPVTAPDLEAAIDSLRNGRGIVLDLRGNTGGVANMLPWFAGQFFCDSVSIGSFIARTGTFAINAVPRRTPGAPASCAAFTGQLAILIDGHSHSTTEMFAASMQSLGRVRVFGDTSFGGVVGATYDRLPNGDVLEHPVVDFTTATKTHPEGTGVIPDVRVPLTRADLLGGRDAALDAALRWIDPERATRPTPRAPHQPYGQRPAFPLPQSR